jgi:hypothetical protein
MVSASARMVNSTWPFPTEDNPLTPWTPEQQRKWAEEQRAKFPDSPM